MFGWAYLGASLVPPIESRLATTKGLAYVDSLIPRDRDTLSLAVTLDGSQKFTRLSFPRTLAFSTDGRRLAASAPTKVRLWDTRTGGLLVGPNSSSENFVSIGHALIALLVALAGGLLSRWLFIKGGAADGEVPLDFPQTETSGEPRVQ